MQSAIPTLKTIGKVGRPHGYKGNLRVFLDYDLIINSPSWIWLDFGYDFIPFTIEEIIRQQGRDWVIKLTHCSSEEEVKPYVNASLAISEEDFNQLLPDCLMPIAPDYTLIEAAVVECAWAGCDTIWVICNDDLQVTSVLLI